MVDTPIMKKGSAFEGQKRKPNPSLNEKNSAAKNMQEYTLDRHKAQGDYPCDNYSHFG
jgi:hypothetical protein